MREDLGALRLFRGFSACLQLHCRLQTAGSIFVLFFISCLLQVLNCGVVLRFGVRETLRNAPVIRQAPIRLWSSCVCAPVCLSVCVRSLAWLGYVKVRFWSTLFQLNQPNIPSSDRVSAPCINHSTFSVIFRFATSTIASSRYTVISSSISLACDLSPSTFLL